MGRRIYLASSWRNAEQPALVGFLRDLGHEVYDFRHPEPGDDGFSWSSVDPTWAGWNPRLFRDQLGHPLAVEGFSKDMQAMRRADTFVLLLPCDRSAHLEAGWAMGRGVPTALFLQQEGFEPELMYRMATALVCNLDELATWLAILEAGHGRGRPE